MSAAYLNQKAMQTAIGAIAAQEIIAGLQAAIIDASIEILLEIQPATVRAVCYQLFIRGLIPEMTKQQTDKVSRLLVRAREAGTLPWHWIVDETREAEVTASWKSPMEVLQAAMDQYRKDYWSEQPNHIEIWSEKGTVRGTLAPVLRKYGVTLRVMHGFSSATTANDIAGRSLESDKPCIALYVGDWDPSGMYMSQVDLPDRVSRYGGKWMIERIAITRTDGRDLPHFDAETKSKDPRHNWFTEHFGSRCWELDAMSPAVLRDRVEHQIRLLLDRDAWQHSLEIEAAERESFTEVQSAIASVLTPGAVEGAR